MKKTLVKRVRLNRDNVIKETVTVLTRITELATQARNPVYDGFSRKATTEVEALRETLIDLANTRDYMADLFLASHWKIPYPFC